MISLSKSKSYSRRSAGVLLLVGVLAGLTVDGGVGVIAASSTKTVTVCANKKTNALRYAKNGKCKKTERKVVLNQTGAAGAKGDTGAAGAAGAAGAKGDAGTAGTNATVAITQLSICGVGGTSLCKVGVVGPGGGIIFFVDYNDQYVGLNYLEAAPQGWSNGLPNVNLGGVTGEVPGTATEDPKMKWCSDTTSLLGLNAWSNSAVGAGASNTSTADTTCAGGAIQAASDYAGGSKSDWFLPSVGEAMLMYTNLRQQGVGGFASDSYWSSSEDDADYAWSQRFYSGNQGRGNKSTTYYVRPVRAF